MFNTLFGNIGHAVAMGCQAQQASAQQYPAHYYAQQQAMAQQQAQHMGGVASQNAYQAPTWMFNGRILSVQDFAKECFGDTPEATMFILKYTKGEEN